MNTLEELTLVGVYLSEGVFERINWRYQIEQQEGSYRYNLDLGDPVSDDFTKQCKLTIYKDYLVYSFTFQRDDQWRLVETSPKELVIKDLPTEREVPEALGESFDTIFKRYYQEYEHREWNPPPQSLKLSVQEKVDPKTNIGEIMNYLDSDLVDSILELAGRPETQIHDIMEKTNQSSIRQIERLREVGQFLTEQMTEKDSTIKELQETIEVNQKAFPPEEKKKVMKFNHRVFVDGVWTEGLTLRLAFPSEEKEKAIRNYFEELVKTWLPIALGHEIETVVDGESPDQKKISLDQTSINQEKPILNQELDNLVVQEQSDKVTQRNFYNDLQEYGIYPGETKLLKELCKDNPYLSETVYEYVTKYGRYMIKNWWNAYQDYSDDIDF